MNKILVFGLLLLFISSSFTASVNSVLASSSELVADSWNLKTPMNQTRQGFGVIGVAGQIYVIGGFYNEEIPSYDAFPLFVAHYVGTNERYDPVSDKWVTLEPMPTPRAYLGIVVYQSKIYCVGGTVGVTEVYDPATNSWSTKAAPPIGSGGRAHMVDGKIFVSCGENLFMYDPQKDSWIEKTQIPYIGLPGATVSVVVDDKMLFVYLIESDWPYDRPCHLKVALYDPKTDVWSERKTTAEIEFGVAPIAAGVTTGVFAPQKVYVLRDSLSPVGQLFNQVYDPINDTWATSKVTSVDNWLYCKMAVVNDVLYVIGDTVTKQYVPMDYTTNHNDVSQSTTAPYTSEETSFSISSELAPSETMTKSFLNNPFTIVVLVLTVCIGTGVLFFYLTARKNKRSKYE